MTRANRRHIDFWLAFTPETADDFVRKADAYDELVPHLMGEIRDLRHQINCLLTQSGEQIEMDSESMTFCGYCGTLMRKDEKGTSYCTKWDCPSMIGRQP